jgi:hypothetical protein
MDLLHPPPVNVTTLFSGFYPCQLRISSHHGVNGLANSLLIDLLDVDLQAISSFDDDFTLSNKLALQQRFVRAALPLHGVPGKVALPLLVALLVQVFHRFEGDFATAVQGQVATAFQACTLVELVTFADKGQVTPVGELAADVAYVGHFVAAGFLGAEAAFLLLVVEAVFAVLCGQQLEIFTGVEIGLVTGLELAGDNAQVFRTGRRQR